MTGLYDAAFGKHAVIGRAGLVATGSARRASLTVDASDEVGGVVQSPPFLGYTRRAGTAGL